MATSVKHNTKQPLLTATAALFVLSALVVLPAAAQGLEGVLPLDAPVQRFLLRQRAAGRLRSAFLNHRPLSAYEAQRYLDTLSAHREALSDVDRQLLDQYQYEVSAPGASWGRRRISWLYANEHDFFSARGNDFALQVHPLLYVKYGRARQTVRGDREAWESAWQNTRGARADGRIDVGPETFIFFETSLEETQRHDPASNRPPFTQKTAPRLGRAKFIDSETYDYQRAVGLVGLRARHFEVRLGRSCNHWGPGRTSLLLSDYAPPYDQLQIRTTFWRLQYTNLFASMTDLTPLPAHFQDFDLPNKFGAFHRLALDLPGSLEVGMFEGIVFAPDSTEQTRLDVELAYFNPLIFYRAVEADLGSPDNVMLGLDASWSFRPGLQVYGQFVLDEFVLGKIFTPVAKNKYGLLLGTTLTDLPLPNLSLAAEYARLRPYLYTHEDPSTSYTHYNDPLGHPAGPNAEDVAFYARYRPTTRFEFALNVAYTRSGRAPSDSINVGADPLVSYHVASTDEAPFLGGVRQRRLLVEAHAGYELLPRLFLEAALRLQSLDDARAGVDRYVAPSLSLRWGIPFRSRRY